MERTGKTTLSLTLWCCALVGCGDPGDMQSGANPQSATGPLKVYVVNYPLQYFAQRVGGEHIVVHFPAPADVDPAYWTPEADVVAQYQSADLILLNGAGYAKWTQTVSLPDTKLVDTTGAVRDQYITTDDGVTHAHGPGDEHVHAGTAFTTWLDPSIAIAQAEAIFSAFSDVRSEHADAFAENLAALRAELTNLDDGLSATVGDGASQAILFSHPVYQYLERRYQLNAKSVHWEPDALPTEAMWSDLESLLTEHSAKWMIWEGPPLDETKRRLEKLGVQSVVVAPCGNAPISDDFLATMQASIETLKRVYGDNVSQE